MKDHIKKLLLCLCAMLTALILCCPAAGRSEGKKKLTLMVYMCGSNLESGHGCATRDLREMMRCGFPEEDVNLVVMIGGSSSWALHPDLKDTMILEIGNGSQRIVREAAQQNMGESETLTDLLVFGRENYPAERYALILWNHGGGPMEGACWDQLFSLDNLSLDEITEGIRQADYPEKLSWIGFDACLMSSLEVATALSPYAEYMIASQETEPSYGWNYAFLKDISADETGADTGKRIVDLYFEGHEDSKDVLTMACLDLSKASEAADALDNYFSTLSGRIDEHLFSLLSGVRMHATGFGKGVRGTEETGYDLVDAVELVSRLGEESGSAADPEQKLKEMVVYSRSNEEGVNGISLYHPYTNKEGYLEKWSAVYENLGFCPGYTQYIHVFGAILTGESITEWDNLQTVNLGLLQFAVQLSEEQAENFADAQLLILVSGFENIGEMDNCVLVYSAPAAIDGNGKVTGEWPARLLYAEDEKGNLYGPLSFLLTDDGKYQVVAAVYTPEGKDTLQDATEVRYYLEEIPGSDEPEIAQIKVRSQVTGTFTNREDFSEDGYRLVDLWYYFRTTPGDTGTEPWPGYMDWPRNTGVAHAIGLDLPQQWKFRYVDGFRSGEQYFAVFQVEDSQQNLYCSKPVAMDNPNLTVLEPEEETGTAGDIEVSLSVIRDDSESEPSLQLFVTCTNHGEALRSITISDIVLNGALTMQKTGYLLGPEPGTSDSCRIDLPKEDLITQEDLWSIAFTVTGDNEDHEQITTGRVQFTFGGDPLFAKEESSGVLARTETDGLVWELLETGTDENGNLVLTFHIVNNSETDRDMDYGDVEINNLLLDADWYGEAPMTLRAGEEAVAQVTVHNDSGIDNFYNELTLKGVRLVFSDLILAKDILQTEGITEIRRIALLNESNSSYLWMYLSFADRETKTVFEMEPAAPIPMQLAAGQDARHDLLLAENDRFELRLERLLLGENGTAVCLRAENRSDTQIKFMITDLEINGQQAVPGKESIEAIVFRLNPGMTTWHTGQITLPEAMPDGTELREISFTIRTDAGDAFPVVIGPKEPTAFGEEGGTLLKGGQVENR